MKRILTAGERCGLFSWFDRNSIYKTSRVFTLLALLFLVSSSVSAQTNQSIPSDISLQKSLSNSIGKKLDKNFVIGYDPFDINKVYTLGDFKGKAVIIDFWATWCTACIGKFPIMDSLYKAYGGQLEILLVNILGRDTPETIRIFIENYRQKFPNLSLTFLISDDSYVEHFNFRSLPHYTWIDPNRRIRAHTNYENFNDDFLNRLLLGLPVHAPLKLR